MPAQYGKVWGSVKQLEDLKLPSGEICQVRRPGVDGLMAAGVLNQLDTLTTLVDTKHVKPQRAGGKGKGKAADPTAEAMRTLMADPTALQNVKRVCLKVVEFVVVQPTVRLHFTESVGPDGKPEYSDLTEEERDFTPDPQYPDNPVIYTDQIELEDAMFLLSYAMGGTRNLERFRGELSESVASLESLEDVPDAAKPAISD